MKSGWVNPDDSWVWDYKSP
jgi:hypothetical protein